ncbi:MAG: MFS transporter [Nocardioides sp.]
MSFAVGRAGRPAARQLLTLASIAVAFAAADTYVVVLALPEMMTSAGISLDQLQRAAPIVSGFLLGYVAMLPLIGRLSDLRGRTPVLIAALVTFAAGSVITAAAYDLTSMVGGRFLQGIGAGGLVPATLALVADLYPVDRRGLPLGVISGVQELGSVLGPLFGAAVLSVASWRGIFAINVAVALILAAAIRGRPGDGSPARSIDAVGLALLLVTVALGSLVFLQPPSLLRDLTWGAWFVPYAGSGRWFTPIGLLTCLALAATALWCWWARRPFLDLRSWCRDAVRADLTGGTLLALALAGVILAFAGSDPRVQLMSPAGGWYLTGSVIATAALWWHLRRAREPLLPRGTLTDTVAWACLAASFFVGAALIAALIDIPIFARTTAYPDSQLSAALVLVRFLVALPVGALAGGWLIRRLDPGVVAAAGMACAAAAFVSMSRWDLGSLEAGGGTGPLLLGGFGFGLALAPLSSALLAVTPPGAHGVASGLLVVARMVGMLVGISALTAVGLRRYYAEQRDLPAVREVCDGASRCAEFDRLLQTAGIAQEQAVFAGAAVCAALAGLLSVALVRNRYGVGHES